jgi:RNA polymerase sigma-70 factor (ECF subfamily)
VARGEASERPSRVLEEAFREAEPFLRALALRYCRNLSDAGDLVQDTYLRAMRSRERAVRDPRRWFARILHNLFIDRCREQSRRPVHEPLNDQNSMAPCECEIVDDAQPAWSQVTLDDVRAVLEDVEPDFRIVFEMHVFDHRSYEEIAVALDINRITVGTRLNRARRRLRTLLNKRLGEEPDHDPDMRGSARISRRRTG